MPTQEDRIVTLEQKVATLELERLYEKRKVSEGTPSEQANDLSEVSYRLTILLGIASGQEHAIRLMQGDLGIVRDDLSAVKNDLGTVKEDLSAVKNDLGTVKEDLSVVKEDLGIVKERLGAFEQRVNTRFEEQDKKLDDLHAKFDQQGKLLLQILERLPSA